MRILPVDFQKKFGFTGVQIIAQSAISQHFLRVRFIARAMKESKQRTEFARFGGGVL